MQPRPIGRLLAAGGTASLMAVALPAAAMTRPVASHRAASPTTTLHAVAVRPATEAVVVVLRDQQTTGSPLAPARAAAFRAEQAPFITSLAQSGAEHVHALSLVNMITATVSPVEEAQIAADPAVASVIPDALVPGPTAASDAPAAAAAHGATTTAPAGACPSSPTKPLLEPQALQVTSTDFGSSSVPSAHALGFDGTGVKVAVLADGIDTSLTDLTRADGQPVVVDYQDFTGEGTSYPTAGEEAMGDASSIASQGREVYDLSKYVSTANPLPAGCNVRILGVAPGASIVALKVFGATHYSTTSGFLQAIDYAVKTDHVNVINESFGSQPFPDTSMDAIRIADDAAVKAGVTVVASTGDSGTNSSIGSPASDPQVISVGATTTWRSYAEDTYGGFQLSNGRWLNDNVSSLSSGGFSQGGGTVTLVAPGDLGWALCSTNVSIYESCTDDNGNPSPIDLFGGTSESSPLTAGAAALVIQAYRSTHAGATPTPAVVREILTSTATDIDAPAVEQGAGLLDTLGAVELAQSFGTPATAGKSAGGVAVTPSQVDVSAAPGTSEPVSVSLTNTSKAPELVKLSTRVLAEKIRTDVGTVTLDTTSTQQFTNWVGVPDVYTTTTFAVPAGAARLQFQAAYQGSPANGLDARVRFALLEPDGTYAGYSVPQGVGNYGNVEVSKPVAGTWTAIFFTTASSAGTSGPVTWQATAWDYGSVGTVPGGTSVIGAGKTKTLTVTLATPATPGDEGVSIVVDAVSTAGTQVTTIPVVLRSKVALGKTGGSFTGIITGGNGRSSDDSQTSTYYFDVPKGLKDIEASITLADDPYDLVYAFLVDPHGQTLAQTSNYYVDGTGTLQPGISLTLYRLAPAAGQWSIVMQVAEPVTGFEVSQAFMGRIAFDQVSVASAGVPDSSATVLPAGTPVTATLTVTNTGSSTESFFADPRTSTYTSLPLAAYYPQTGLTLPLSDSAPPPASIVPTETESVTGAGQATNASGAAVPMELDFGPFTGDPDTASPAGTSPSATISEPEVTPGTWALIPSEVGPYPAGGATAATANVSLTAHTLGFDSSVSTTTGDLWQLAESTTPDLTPLVLAPGASGTITVTFTPTGAAGTVVSGTLFVDDYASGLAATAGTLSGDELAAVPYTYTAG